MAHTVFCVKLKRELPGLDEPPFDNDLGQKVYNNVSQEAWRMWTEHCKMLLNEYRLNPARREDQEVIVKQMDIDQVFERLPKGFRVLCEGVIIRVDDFPTEEVLDEMKAESEFDLLGLFQGIGLPFRSNDDIARLPNMVWLYRRPILDYWAEHEETLGHIVRHVLIHEIGHHFGLSDADMEAIEAQA